MDHMKQALKKRMTKVLTPEEQERDTDLAPDRINFEPNFRTGAMNNLVDPSVTPFADSDSPKNYDPMTLRKMSHDELLTLSEDSDDPHQQKAVDDELIGRGLSPLATKRDSPMLSGYDPSPDTGDMPGMQYLPDRNDAYAKALISQAPDHPASGKTLESIAKERAIKRSKLRTDQSTMDQQPVGGGSPFRKRK